MNRDEFSYIDNQTWFWVDRKGQSQEHVKEAVHEDKALSPPTGEEGKWNQQQCNITPLLDVNQS